MDKKDVKKIKNMIKYFEGLRFFLLYGSVNEQVLSLPAERLDLEHFEHFVSNFMSISRSTLISLKNKYKQHIKITDRINKTLELIDQFILLGKESVSESLQLVVNSLKSLEIQMEKEHKKECEKYKNLSPFGSKFDDFLEEVGILDIADISAQKEILEHVINVIEGIRELHVISVDSLLYDNLGKIRNQISGIIKVLDYDSKKEKKSAKKEDKLYITAGDIEGSIFIIKNNKKARIYTRMTDGCSSEIRKCFVIDYAHFENVFYYDYSDFYIESNNRIEQLIKFLEIEEDVVRNMVRNICYKIRE